MISVDDALARLSALCTVLTKEEIPLRQAAGRVLAAPVVATRDQPPFAASAMDGYAIKKADHKAGRRLTVIGEAAAGHGYAGALYDGEALRIFTGAPMPLGSSRVVIQEDVTRTDDHITLGDRLEAGDNVRQRGQDFRTGDDIAAPRLLSATDLALVAAMNVPLVTVVRRPVVAFIATGDELVIPGGTPGPDQIMASNAYALAAIAETAGANARVLPIAADTDKALHFALDLAKDADLIVTIGGASVGDHDLVARITVEAGMERSFYKIAMRPGKPLMAGRIGKSVLLGLPGNPVSAIVCGYIFMLPMLRAMQGLQFEPAASHRAVLAQPVAPNGIRAHYMRAHVEDRDGEKVITAFAQQDSALLRVLSRANALLIRPANDEARPAGAPVRFIPL